MLKGRIVSGKIVSILLAVTMMAGCILTGCGSGESGGLGAGGKEAEAANGPAAGKGEGSQDGTSGKPAEVSVIIETFDNTFAYFVMNAMKKYEEEHPAILKVESYITCWYPWHRYSVAYTLALIFWVIAFIIGILS